MQNEIENNRRGFLKNTVTAAAGLLAASIPVTGFSAQAPAILSRKASMPIAPRLRFSVIGLNHGHIYGMTDSLIRGGGELVSFYAVEPDLIATFSKRFPNAKLARNEAEVLEDKSVQLVASASIPSDRAPLGIKVMQHGKDYVVDKPGITSLKQLAAVKKVQAQTKRIYSIVYSERLENKATVKALEMVQQGAIGKVVQTMGTGPHRANFNTRPEWFFDKKYFGGIICDIGSHQFDQFLAFTGSTKADIVSAQVGNINHPQYPNFEDYGDAVITGNGGTGVVRVDWFTPDGLKTWGDGRLTVLGTEGYMELRKYIDIDGRPGGSHLFVVDNKSTRYIDCKDVELPFSRQLIDDIINRTEIAMTQEHCFLATELTLKAQAQAKLLKLDK